MPLSHSGITFFEESDWFSWRVRCWKHSDYTCWQSVANKLASAICQRLSWKSCPGHHGARARSMSRASVCQDNGISIAEAQERNLPPNQLIISFCQPAQPQTLTIPRCNKENRESRGNRKTERQKNKTKKKTSANNQHKNATQRQIRNKNKTLDRNKIKFLAQAG